MRLHWLHIYARCAKRAFDSRIICLFEWRSRNIFNERLSLRTNVQTLIMKELSPRRLTVFNTFFSTSDRNT